MHAAMMRSHLILLLFIYAEVQGWLAIKPQQFRSLKQHATILEEDDLKALLSKADSMKEAASGSIPFSELELDKAIVSMRNVAEDGRPPMTAENYATYHFESVDLGAYRGRKNIHLQWNLCFSTVYYSALCFFAALVGRVAHKNFKNWAETGRAAEALVDLLGGPDNVIFRRVFRRVLRDGRWDEAAAAASAVSSRQPQTDDLQPPWCVLVSGLNGIRKTSALHEPWFQQCLAEAIEGPKYGGMEKAIESENDLPSAGNSFFRQLDYMIATVANEEFRELYAACGNDPDNVAAYSKFKDGIFSRYRTLAEIVGVLLVRECQRRRMNVLLETSGRDIGMFKYVDHFFPTGSGFHKLVVRFEINDLSFAEQSVDARMLSEMAIGEAASASASVSAVIDANQGGPYGSAVLAGVKSDSDRVWESIVESNGLEEQTGSTWHKAVIAIDAHANKPWTARAKVPGATTFEFSPRNT
jgi:hypothetical protein